MEEVIVNEKKSSRILILNRPKQLNALSYKMLSFMTTHFPMYEKDPGVKCIILKANGRGFCVGGDVSTMVHDIKQGNWKVGAHYFHKTYTLNYLLATSLKPQVSIINGIVMGAGVGLSIHGKFRVATEKSVFAMPETALGLFPDIGASYFLSRLPGFYGEYAGLTGSRLDGAEMLVGGLATHFVPSERLSSLEEALIEADSSDPTIISAIINNFSVVPNLKEGSAFYKSKIINSCFSRKTVEEIISALEKEADGNKDKWILSMIRSLQKASPTSLKISLRSIREGRLEGIGKCLVREYKIVSHILKGAISKDFYEGCRAILLDKDRNPKWSPATLEEVSDEMVDKYFTRVEDEDWEDLKLPPGSNLPPFAIAKL